MLLAGTLVLLVREESFCRVAPNAGEREACLVNSEVLGVKFLVDRLRLKSQGSRGGAVNLFRHSRKSRDRNRQPQRHNGEQTRRCLAMAARKRGLELDLGIGNWELGIGQR
jgi:hypothetical protein